MIFEEIIVFHHSYPLVAVHLDLFRDATLYCVIGSECSLMNF